MSRPRGLPKTHGFDGIAGFIYFIQEDELKAIKIGFTSGSPLKRLQTLNNASSQLLTIIGVEFGNEKKEAALHARFNHLRKRREWFHPGQDLLDCINALDYGQYFNQQLAVLVGRSVSTPPKPIPPT